MQAKAKHTRLPQPACAKCVFAGFILLALTLPQAAHARSANAALDALIAVYPDALVRHDGSAIYWRDGTRMPVGSRSEHKSFDQLLRNASILDQFRLP